MNNKYSPPLVVLNVVLIEASFKLLNMTKITFYLSNFIKLTNHHPSRFLVSQVKYFFIVGI